MVIKTNSSESQKNSNYNFIDCLKDFKSGFNVFILQAISVISVVILFYAIKYNVSDTLMLHIIFCCIGYAFLMTCSILLFAGDNFFGRPMNRYHKALIHGVFIGSGSVLAVTGISIEIASRGTEWPHFSSAHSIAGLVSMILMIIAFCGGIVANHIQIVRKIIPFIKPIWWKICHNSMGLSAYIVGIVSICLSTQTWWALEYIPYEQRTAIIIVTAIVGVWTTISALITLFGYVKSVF